MCCFCIGNLFHFFCSIISVLWIDDVFADIQNKFRNEKTKLHFNFKYILGQHFSVITFFSSIEGKVRELVRMSHFLVPCASMAFILWLEWKPQGRTAINTLQKNISFNKILVLQEFSD